MTGLPFRKRLRGGEIWIDRRPDGSLYGVWLPFERSDPDWPGFSLDQESGSLPDGDVDRVLRELKYRPWYR